MDGAFAGRNARLHVSTNGTTWVLVGGCEDIDFDGSKAQHDSTAREDGAYKTSLDGHKEGTISASGRFDDTDQGQQMIEAAFSGDTALWARWRTREATGKPERIAKVGVDSWKETGPIEGVTGFSCSLKTRGSFAFSAQA